MVIAVPTIEDGEFKLVDRECCKFNAADHKLSFYAWADDMQKVQK